MLVIVDQRRGTAGAEQKHGGDAERDLHARRQASGQWLMIQPSSSRIAAITASITESVIGTRGGLSLCCLNFRIDPMENTTPARYEIAVMSFERFVKLL